MRPVADGAARIRPGRVFVTDFGLAKATTTGSKFTRSGTTLGTPAYMSPEQARGELAALTPASDVWALGCVLYELVSGGRRAFEAEHEAAVLAMVLTGRPAPLRAAPTAAAALVAAALHTDAGRRYQGAGPLRDDCIRVLAGRPPSARPPRDPRRWAIGAVLGAAAIVGASALAGRGSPGVNPTADAPPSGEALAAQARGRRHADPREAARLLEAALRAAPDRHDWRLELGLLRWATGAGPEARAAWGLIPGDAPEWAQAVLYRGLEALFRLDGVAALPDLRALQDAPDATGQLARAALATLGRDWAGARASLEGVPGWEAALQRAVIETRDPSGDPRQTVRAYDAALADGLVFAWAVTNRGNAKHAAGDLTGALADYEAALVIDPRASLTVNNRGTTRQALGDLAGALADYDAALALDPRYATAYANRGLARRAVGRLAEALADFDTAVALDPRDAQARRYRADAKCAIGDLAGALADYDAAVEIDPDDAATLTNRGAARGTVGDLAGARADFDAALARDPRDLQALVNRGRLKQLAGDLVGALADCDAAIALDPHAVDALLRRGQARHAADDLNGAMADFDAVLALDPRQWTALAGRGLAKHARGDAVGAVADFERALAVAPAGWGVAARVVEWLADARASLAAAPR